MAKVSLIIIYTLISVALLLNLIKQDLQVVKAPAISNQQLDENVAQYLFHSIVFLSIYLMTVS